VAPAAQACTNSDTEASKPIEANRSTRSPGPMAARRASSLPRFAMPRWDTPTPFGRPVEPEV